MKKLLILLIILLWSTLTAHCEVLSPFGSGTGDDELSHPIHFLYMKEYTEALRDALKKKKMFVPFHWGVEYYFIVTREGEILDMKVSLSQNDYFDKKIKEVITSVEPPPFKEGMDSDYVLMDVYMGFESYEDISYDRGLFLHTLEPCLDIKITLKRWALL